MKKTTEKNKKTEKHYKVQIAETISTGAVALAAVIVIGVISHVFAQLGVHQMEVKLAGERIKAQALRDVTIVALQQKLEGSFNASASAVIECDYDGWQALPNTINKTTALAQALGMLPDKAHCVITGTGGFGGTGSVPVALMDEDIMRHLKGQVGARS